jgi:hypothetical protein
MQGSVNMHASLYYEYGMMYDAIHQQMSSFVVSLKRIDRNTILS